MTGPAAPLWTAGEVAAAVGSALPEGLDPGTAITGVSIDTRTLNPGDLFIALVGPNHDGHDHVGKALDRGAAACLLARRPEEIAATARVIPVGDTQSGLEALGAAARARSRARILAITGSVGKTSTKEMAALALGAYGQTHASASSLNNHWGVPLSLARLPREAAFGVFELGMNHAGEIAALTRQVRPDAALITNVEPAHLEFFADVAAIADAKAEIFFGLSEAGTAILNLDSPFYPQLEKAAWAAGAGRIVNFGLNTEADAFLIKARYGPDSSEVVADVMNWAVGYTIGQPGRHLVFNSLAVMAAIEALGENPAVGAERLALYAGVQGRGQRHVVEVPGGFVTVIDETYNANPASMAAAFAVAGDLEPGPGGRRIAVLGDMRELGPAGPDLHRGLKAPLEAAGIDVVFGCGFLIRHLIESLPPWRRGAWEPDAASLAPIVRAALRPGDIVTIKGSLGSRMADILKPLLGGEA
jgi:UDP-N-acetylmuramoyl-tripeptide--D-alanyl-D-alanine ligase